MIVISEHKNDIYNGAYKIAENWEGNPHFQKIDQKAHLYFYKDRGRDLGYWLLD